MSSIINRHFYTGKLGMATSRFNYSEEIARTAIYDVNDYQVGCILRRAVKVYGKPDNMLAVDNNLSVFEWYLEKYTFCVEVKLLDNMKVRVFIFKFYEEA